MQVNKHNNSFDLIIVGAGLVGTSLVVGLQRAGLRILMLEKHLPAIIDADKEDSRPLALAYGSQRCLERWGVWSSLAANAMPITTLHVSEQGRLGRVQFTANEFQLPALGYVVPFSLLQRTLYERAASQPDVTLTSIEKITSLICDEQGVTMEYIAADKKHHVSAALLIAADGAQSTCRHLLNITANKSEVDKVAVIATFCCRSSHRGKAYQRFTRQGSFALLPLLDQHRYRLVWTLSQRFYEKVRQWSDEKLLATIREVYGGRLGEISQIQRDAMFPLQMIVADEVIRPSAVLLGNAAHTIYPIAAQSFNLSLHDVAALAGVLQRATAQGVAIGARSTLQRYLDRRDKNQQTVIQWTKRIATVFNGSMPFLGHVRGAALLGLDMLSLLKENFARNFLH